MKVIFWTLVTLAGLVLGLGELTYAKYIAGEKIADAVLFDEGVPLTHEIEVAEADLPVRLNLKMWGDRDTTGAAHHSKVTLTTGGDAPGDAIEFQAAVDEKGDLANASLGTEKLILKPNRVPNMVQSSQLFVAATAGIWTLSASATDEHRFEMKRIEAVVKRNSRAVNWQLAGPGLAMLLIGFIVLVATLRKRHPHLAT